jgi:hypothetical protein
VMQHTLPPVGVGPQANEPTAGARSGAPALPPSSRSQTYPSVQPPQGYDTAGTRPYYTMPGTVPPGPAGSAEQDAILRDAMRPPPPINSVQAGPAPVDPRVTGSAQVGDPHNMAAFPPEVRPAMTVVSFRHGVSLLREVLAGLTPASIRRLQSFVVT